MDILKNIPIYWINLEKSLNRFDFMTKLFKQYNIINNKRIIAIDGNNIDISKFNIANISKYELACSLSHFKAIQQAFDDNNEYALIIEDDCNFDYIKYHHVNLIELINSNTNCEILQLAISGRNDYNNNISLLNNNTIFKGRRDCTTCYLINKAGMLKVITYFNGNNIIDKADKTIYEIANTYYTKPYFSYSLSHVFSSTIHITNYQREDNSKEFWDNYYITHYYKIIILILDSNDINIYSFNRQIWRTYMNSNSNILCLFIKYDNIYDDYYLDLTSNTLYIKGTEISFDHKLIYEKTIKAFKYCYYHFHFDYILRTNISSFWIFDNLLNFMKPRNNNYLFGLKFNKTIDSVKHHFISGTGIFIPNQYVSMIFNYNNFITGFDDIEISYFYNKKNILLKDATRFGEYVVLCENDNLDSLLNKITTYQYKKDIVYFRVKHNVSRDLYDKYMLNKLLQTYYNVNLLGNEELLLEKKIKLFEKHEIKIFVSKKTISFNSKILNLILNNFNNYTITSDTNLFNDSDVIITNICERQEYNNKYALNIVISGESRTTNTKYDISISTVNSFNSIKNIYLPHGISSLYEHKKSINPDDYKNIKKNSFCAFLYSVDVPHRIHYFKLLYKYKKVDGLGKSRNNVNIEDTRFVDNDDCNYNDIAVELYTKYKFVLALENKFVDGYFTEKIMNPLIANSIPIYWGHPSVFNFINKNRVIYIQDFDTDEKLLEYIKFLDNNNDEYLKILNNDLYVNNFNPDNYINLLTSSIF